MGVTLGSRPPTVINPNLSEFCCIERNLNTLNSAPFKPILDCLYRTGPDELILIKRAIKRKKGDNRIKPKKENKKSKILIIKHNFLVRSEHSFTDIVYLLIC